MRLFALLTFVALLLSGCADDAATAPAALDASEAEPEAPGPEPAADREPSVAAPRPDSLTNRTFLGYTAQPEGSTAFELRVDVGPRNRCGFSNELTGRYPGAGPGSIGLTEHADGRASWFMFGPGPVAVAQAGGERLEVLGAGEGSYWSRSWSWGPAEGVVTVTVLASHLAPGDFEGAPEVPLRIEVECERPFSVVGARQGTQLGLFDRGNLQEAVAASAPSVSATYDGRAEVALDAPEARIVGALAGMEYGVLEVLSPEDEAALAMETGLVSLEGGAGPYSVQITEVGGYVNLFWTAMFGFDSPVDLEAGLYDEAVLESRL